MLLDAEYEPRRDTTRTTIASDLLLAQLSLSWVPLLSIRKRFAERTFDRGVGAPMQRLENVNGRELEHCHSVAPNRTTGGCCKAILPFVYWSLPNLALLHLAAGSFGMQICDKHPTPKTNRQ